MLCTVILINVCGCESLQTNESNNAVTLILACWVSDTQVQEMVNQFNELHSEYQIQIKSYFTGDENVNAALDRMNAELVSGDKPDIFYLDSMNVMALVNSGILADLKPFLENDDSFFASKYFSNIWELFEINGSLYELAPCFNIACFYGPQTLLGDMKGWTFSEAEQFIDATTENVPLFRIGRTDMMAYMAQFSVQNYIDIEKGTCNFETNSFYELLKLAKSFPISGNSEYLIYDGWLQSFVDYYDARINLGCPLTLVGYPAEGADGPCAMALTSFGISTTTEHPDACWDFLKLMLTEDNQEKIWGNWGFPISREVLSKELYSATLDGSDPESLLYQWYGDAGKEKTPLNTEETDYLLQVIEDISSARLRYEDVTNIILSEAQAYFNEDKTEEEAAKIIQNRVSIFLSEQQ